ncbi:MAG TPA: M10 family metallopeptidase C-terminal domain-containing protein [Allosphingosinicella sp.]|nr:M10 family metallopeptidase C-terminal domain-containing protein [Allosphingosinicella sp.]
MRGLLNRHGKTAFTPWLEEAAGGAGAFARFDLRPESAATPQAAAQPPLAADLILVTPDEAGDGIGLAPGNPVLTVGAASTIGALGTLGDQDFYQVTLEAGKLYEFGMFAHYPGPNLIPVQDAYLELYAADGTLLASADGGASTVINNVNSGFDAVLTFTATVTGTYYVNARAFDNDPNIGGSTGESVGDYELYAKELDPNDPSVYHPYYDASSPLYAIDWGTQVNRVNETARNPDGNEGTRTTGNAQGTVVLDDPSLIATLAAQQGKDITGKNVVTIYFAQAGDIFTSIEDPTSPGLPPVLVSLGTQQFEKDTVWTALHEFEKVADIVYIEVPTRDQADFFFTTYAGTPGPGVSLLGSMSPPDYPDEGLAQFNSGDERWTESNLQQGGFSFVTLIHEFGHGHGLAHPHDNGGHSGIMNGVESEGVVADYTLGDFELNQAVFTMMSYEDGWQASPYGNAETDVGYGYLGGLMAFDIAAIQDKYGVNESWATGNDTYVLKDENAAGTFYSSIWDGGGVDSIVYAGTRDANIDLRAASLQYEYGGGGWVSYAFGIYGGFTIANGVTIENATGGAGNDTLIGNAAANVLIGGAGNDAMTGGAGNDLFFVDAAGDSVVEAAGEGNDRVYAGASFALTAAASVETLSTDFNAGTAAINLTGSDVANTILGNAGTNILSGGGGNDVIDGKEGNDTLFGGTGADILYGRAGNDVLQGGAGANYLEGGIGDDSYVIDNADTIVELAGEGTDRIFANVGFVLAAGLSVETLSTGFNAGTASINLTGNELANTIFGNAGVNALSGGAGNDLLDGKEGNDVLSGGANDDILYGRDGNDQLHGGAGTDYLEGGAGDDLYFVDGGADLVVELAGQGADRVFASASYALGAGAAVEVLSTDFNAGTASINLTGNELANTLFGNDGANVLNGGAGSDFLDGKGGADSFAFTTALGANNVDTVVGFQTGIDTILLENAVFTALGAAGGLNANAFVAGSGAADASDRIVYNSATGQLFYDADGNGAGAAVQFAQLGAGTLLSASDFQVI